MKRILHIIGTMDRAGAETMLMNLYRVLDFSKYQFDFLYFTNKKCDYDDEINQLGGRIYRLESSPGLKRFTSVCTFLKTHKKFHAIHSHTLLNNGFNVFAAFLTGHRIRVSHSHNTQNSNRVSFVGSSYYHFSKLLINVFSTKYVACGSAAGDYLFYKNKPVVLLPNAVNFDDFKSLKPLKLPSRGDNDIMICQIGRFLEVKNHAFTIKLAEYMKNEEVSFKLLLVGDGELLNNIKVKVDEAGLQSQVIFMGIRNDIPNILKACDIMIMPSYFEGFPVVLVEAQVAGIPSLISSTISSEVDAGVNLIFFESLESELSVWRNRIQEISSMDKNSDARLDTLRERGFDVRSSLSILLNLYSSV